MADDDAGPASSTPWGRPGGRDSATPPPPAAAPLTPPPTTAAPAWATPPPGAYPPAPPPPGRGGMSRGALVALAAVVAVALVLVGAGVFLVTSLGDDEEPDDADLRTSATVPATDPSTTPSSSTSSSSTTEAGSPIGPGGTVSLPPTDTDFAPPEAFPQPEGAAPDGITGGLEVDGTSEEALAFYQEALPGAGFTATRSDLPGIVALEVTGEGLTGQLLFIDIGLGTTTVLWQPA